MSFKPDPRYVSESTAVRRAFARAAPFYDSAAVLPREVARRMAERLDFVKLAPKTVLDLGCGTGDDLRLLATRYPEAFGVGCDFALPMLHRAGMKSPWWQRVLPGLKRSKPAFCCADLHHLPLRSGSVDMAWSNCVLNWVVDPLAVFKELNRVLNVGGLLLFAMPGPDTLKELRVAFSKADDRIHVQRFIDMHDIGDMLVSSGFSDPVMEMELMTITYPDLTSMLNELRRLGGGNTVAGRARGLTGRSAWQKFQAAYEEQRRETVLPVTVELVYGHAWKTAPRTTSDGRSVIQFHSPRR